MNRFQFITRLIILILWAAMFATLLLGWLYPSDMRMLDFVGNEDPVATRSYQYFFVSPGGAIAAVVAFVLFVIVGRRTLRLAFRELSYPQFSLLTLGMACGLWGLGQVAWLMPEGIDRAMLFWPAHKLAYLAGLNMLTVFVPAAAAAILIGWPWRHVGRTGLLSATTACLAYILWCYFFAAALWRPLGIN